MRRERKIVLCCCQSLHEKEAGERRTRGTACNTLPCVRMCVCIALMCDVCRYINLYMVCM